MGNPANWDCWIAPLDSTGGMDCTSSYSIARGGTGLIETDCVRGDNAMIYQWSFFFGPLWASITFCVLAMIQVYRAVRTTQDRSNQYQFRLRLQDGQEKKEKKEKRGGLVSQVKRQSYRYSRAFLIVWTFPTLARLIQLFGGTIHPIIGVFAGTFIGTQGIFNALIYFKPRYDKCVKYNKWYQKVWVLVHSTLFFCCHDGDYTKDAKDYVTPTREGGSARVLAPAAAPVPAPATAPATTTTFDGRANPACTEDKFDQEEKQEEKEEDADNDFAITTIPAQH